MIRVWLWEEAPVELRDYPGLPGLTAGTLPAWLAHAPAARGDEADALHDVAAAWRSGRGGRELHAVAMAGDAGVLVAGCLSDGPVAGPKVEESAT
jgi:hypothetical protein